MPNIAVLYESGKVTPMVMSEENKAMLAAHNPDGEIRYFTNVEDLTNSGFECEILLTWGFYFPNDYLNGCKNLKLIQALSAGVQDLMKLDCVKSGKVPVTKVFGVHGITMAESTVCYILSFLRGLPEIMANKRNHLWRKPVWYGPDDSYQKTVAIVGIGDIGSIVAQKCKALGFRVIGCKRHVVPMENIDQMYSLDELETVLGQADFVVDVVPDMPSSHDMFNLETFKMMKESAVFINIGRGVTVKTDDLVTALQEGIIRGAALDAVNPEPLNEDSPLWDMENVIISPHCSADSPWYFDRAFPLFCENIDRVLKGEPLLGVVKE